MTVFLSEAWFAAAIEALAGVSGVSSIDDADARVQYVISEAPDGKTTLHVEIRQGVVRVLELGKAIEPDIILSCSYETALDLIAGRQTADASFMSGALKVEGDHARWLLDLRPTREASLDVLGPLTDG